MSGHPTELRLAQWEAAFADGLVAIGGAAPDPWISGRVYTIDASPQPEFVRTGAERCHSSVVLLADGICQVEERIANAPPHLDCTVAPGDLLVYSPALGGQPHLTRWTAQARLVTLFVEPAVMERAAEALDLDCSALEFLDRFPTRDPLLEHLARALAAEAEAGAPGGRLYAEEVMQAVAVHLVAKHTAEEPAERRTRGGLPRARLRRVEEYVAAHLDGELTLEALAEAAGGAAGAMNEYHFLRLFKEATGRTPYRWVIERRMAEARRRLRETDEAVIQVALAVGYQSPGHFSQVFKRHAGTTPTAYRRQTRR